MKKNINRVAFFNFLSILLLQGISFISSPVFARLLGTDGYGNLSSFNIWVSVVCTVLSLQTNMTIVNAQVEFPESEQPAYQSSIMTLSLMVFVIGGAVAALFVGPIASALQVERFMVAVLLLQSFGSFCVNFLSSKFTYEFKADKNMLLSVCMAVSTLVLSLVMVLNMPVEQRFLGRVLGNAVVYIAVGIGGCFCILRRGRRFVDKKYWKFCILLAWPMVWQALSYQILGSSDIMMLKQMTTTSESGIYGLAFTLSGIMFTIFTALNSSWLPFFFDDMKCSKREQVVAQGSHFLELFTVLSVGFVLLVREVYHIYADESFWPGVGLIPIFVASYYVNFLNTFPVSYEYFHKKTKVISFATVAAALLNLLLNYLFIRAFGAVGAAAATLLSHGIQFGMHECYVIFVMGKKDYPFFGIWGKYAAVFLAAVALFYATPNLWLLRWGLGAAVGVWELWRIWKRRSLL